MTDNPGSNKNSHQGVEKENLTSNESQNPDEQAWQEAVRGVKKIATSTAVVNKTKKISRRIEKYQTVALKLYDHPLELGTTADIDANTMRRFKREEFPVEGILDLHGYNEERAFEAVRQFIIGSYSARKRCVIIVTGKGVKHAQEDIFAPRGVLKDRVPQWLKSDDLRQLILTYIHPSQRLGGQGALYILLRRHRG